MVPLSIYFFSFTKSNPPTDGLAFWRQGTAGQQSFFTRFVVTSKNIKPKIPKSVSLHSYKSYAACTICCFVLETSKQKRNRSFTNYSAEVKKKKTILSQLNQSQIEMGVKFLDLARLIICFNCHYLLDNQMLDIQFYISYKST